jgi:hypothetical protein
MLICIYETIPQSPGAKARSYEINQEPGGAPLAAHPKTGEPIRRVVLDDLGELTLPEPERKVEADAGSSSACACGRLPWLR